MPDVRNRERRLVNQYVLTRPYIINHWLDEIDRCRDRLAIADGQLLALEVGRMRRAREVTGHSTLHIASHPAVRKLISLDVNPRTERACRRFMPASVLKKIKFVNADGVKWLGEQVGKNGQDFGFIYLDAANDADQGRALLIECLGVSHAGTIILMDDTDHPKVHKGDLALPYARSHPKLFRIIEERKRDRTSQGMTAIRVEAD